MKNFPSQRELDESIMEDTKEYAKFSDCVSKKVGAIAILKSGHRIYGHNKTPNGTIKCKDFYSQQEKILKLVDNLEPLKHLDFNRKFEVHAEADIVTQCAKSLFDLEGATIYINYQPCWDCSKLLIQSGVKRIVYLNDWEKMPLFEREQQRKFFLENNVQFEKF